MQGSHDETANKYNISLGKNFDFEGHHEFRKLLKEAFEQKTARLLIDFDVVEYMDSSALGMLMLAKHESESQDCIVELVNVHGFSEKVLRIVEFDKLFTFKTK